MIMINLKTLERTYSWPTYTFGFKGQGSGGELMEGKHYYTKIAAEAGF